MMHVDRRRIIAGLAAFGAIGVAGFEVEQRRSRAAVDEASLAPSEHHVVAAIADVIIPPTDTPGASGAGVPAFIGLLFGEWMLASERHAFRAGLHALEGQCRGKFGRPFAVCSAAQRAEMVESWDRAAAVARRANKSTFFGQFKAATVFAYFTSQVGQVRELRTSMDAGEHVAGGPIADSMSYTLGWAI